MTSHGKFMAILIPLLPIMLVAMPSRKGKDYRRPVVIGEVIVKFKQGQGIDPEISAALEKGSTRSDFIDKHIAALSEKVSIPLRAQRITSGRELVVEIRQEDIFKNLVDTIAQSPAVKDVEVSLDRSKNPLYAENKLIVTFTPSSEAYTTLSRAIDKSSSPEESVQSLVDTLAKGTPYKLSGRALPDGQLLLTVDMQALTADLVRALNRREEIEYAQLNFAAQSFP